MSSPLGAALTETLLRLLPPRGGARDHLEAVVCGLTEALEQGQIGLELEGEAPAGVSPDHWPDAVLASLQASGWLAELDADEAPIVRDGCWLRWRRWHQHLVSCLGRLLELSNQPIADPPSDHHCTQAQQQAERAGLDRRQIEAVMALLQRRLVLLTGGPGTGKTSTVVQMLAAALQHNPGLRVALAAPTGKAATRLLQAVAEGSAHLSPSIATALKELPSGTLHRLLEAQGDSQFRRNHHRPLGLDLLVVDEVSMVDLPLMTAVLDALPEQAQLLLVGDPDQLPPVGPGAVLQHLSEPERRRQMGAAAVELRTTYRNNGAIAELSTSLRQNGGGLSRTRLSQLQALDNVVWLEASDHHTPEAVLALLRAQQQQLRQQATALQWQGDEPDAVKSEALLSQLDAVIALSPIRRGAWGVDAIHRALLGDTSRRALQHWPAGTPVLNRHNNPDQGLANGDIGVVVQHEQHTRVLFPGGRILHPAQMAGAEPAFALTVHKSQGSQYSHVVLLLPPLRHPDQRLAYTGLTRAKTEVLLITPKGQEPLARAEQHRHAETPAVNR